MRSRAGLRGVVAAFVRMGIQATISYPMSFALSQLGIVITIITVFFLSKIVISGPHVGGDYLAFVAVGIVGQTLVAGAFQGVSLGLDQAIQQGRLEMLLIEPLRWWLIPVGLAIWPMMLTIGEVVLVLAVALALGVSIIPLGLVEALPLVALGLSGGLALGLLAASVRILAKRSDPVWLVYNIVSGLVAGTSVPINVLPAPLRELSWLLPTMYVESGMRKLVLPHAAAVYGPSPLWANLALLLALVPLAIASVVAFNRSVDLGRHLGVLAGY
jgi:ABC-type uncharacterized transport system permease subunit